MKIFSPDHIESLEPNEIFVFGSNRNGKHAGGAAKTAKDKFGAEEGVSQGVTGQCYAFPTLNEKMKKIPMVGIVGYRDLLFEYAKENRDKLFLMTKVGCGIAGFKESGIKKLFGKDTPMNILLPKDWETRKYVSTGETKEGTRRNPTGGEEERFLLSRIAPTGVVEAEFSPYRDRGGFIEHEGNLSQEGSCFVWNEAVVRDDAKVEEDALVEDRATVRDKARVYGKATVAGESQVFSKAQVYGEASVHGMVYIQDNVRFHGDAIANGDANILEDAEVYDNAQILQNGVVRGCAKVGGRVTVKGDAYVSGDALLEGLVMAVGSTNVTGKAKATENQYIIGRLTKDIDKGKNKEDSLYAQTLHYPLDGKIVLFKAAYRPKKFINEDDPPDAYPSIHDPNFKYRIGETKAVKADESMDSCAEGLHASHLLYFRSDPLFAFLACEIAMEDIITIQQGKVRCRKLKVLSEVFPNGKPLDTGKDKG